MLYNSYLNLTFFALSVSALTLLFAFQASASVIIRPIHNQGLVGYWSMDEGGGLTAYDRSGNLNHGTLTNMDADTDWTDGQLGGALDFDGSNDYITAPDSGVYSGLRAITVSHWVNWESFGGGSNHKFTVGKSNWSSQREWRIRVEDGTNLVWHISNDGNDPDTAEIRYAVSNLTLRKWHHIVGTYDTDNNNLLELYVDGNLVSTATGETGPILNGTAGIGIGSSSDDGAGSEIDNHDGLIDEVRIYNRALTPIEIRRLYQMTGPKIATPALSDGLVGYWNFDEGGGLTAYDRSGNLNHGTLTNMDADTDWTDGQLGGALDFDGSNDYVEVGDTNVLDISSSFSISVWILKGSNTGYDMILMKTPDQNNANYYITTTSDEIAMGFTDVPANWNECATSATNIVTSAWYHLVGVFDDDGNTQTIYVNSLSQAVTGTCAPAVSPQTNAGSIYVGESQLSGGGEWFDGIIDDVRIYNRALTPTEVRRLYNMGR